MPVLLKAGSAAPAFTLSDADGKQHSLKDYAGKWLLLYFYPKDDTPGCTKEACAIRDNFPRFTKSKLAVLGVSKDSAERHAKFAKKYSLPFPLLADEDLKVIKKYKAWGQKKFMGRTYDGIHRISYLINPKGKIAKVYPKVKPAEHAEEVLRDVDTFRASGST